nr:MAG: hypothetical protein [Chemarfal virus 34]
MADLTHDERLDPRRRIRAVSAHHFVDVADIVLELLTKNHSAKRVRNSHRRFRDDLSRSGNVGVINLRNVPRTLSHEGRTRECRHASTRKCSRMSDSHILESNLDIHLACSVHDLTTCPELIHDEHVHRTDGLTTTVAVIASSTNVFGHVVVRNQNLTN